MSTIASTQIQLPLQTQNRDSVAMFINPSTNDKSLLDVTQMAGYVQQEWKIPGNDSLIDSCVIPDPSSRVCDTNIGVCNPAMCSSRTRHVK